MGRSDPVRIIALLELIRQLLNEIAVGLGRRECLDATLLLSALTLVEERLSEAGAAIARQRK
ncbi:hypothetical protein PARPLA_01676 [Rhodobacteraceae bacterium THAF1]|nr:hypothetical protein FIU81_09035 [Palleronia sp. THAF1]VDC23951.1 hypothetical protein PARPLA_01676 [Rhodobacteraceae bacterium THAF1]